MEASWRVKIGLVTFWCMAVLGAPDGGNHHAGHHQASNHVDNYDYSSQNEYDYYDTDADRSYGFQFEGNEYSRKESSDKEGRVTGSYSYRGEDGQQRTVNYLAGNGIGFQVQPDVTSQAQIDAMFASFGRKMSPQSNYHKGSSQNQQQTYSHQSNQGTSGMAMDPSYNFAYQAKDSSRSEETDATGNTRGFYTYRTPTGREIVVKYRAGSDTGFFIENQDELDKAVAESVSSAALIPNRRNGNIHTHSSTSNSVGTSFTGQAETYRTPEATYSPPATSYGVSGNEAEASASSYQVTVDYNGGTGSPYVAPEVNSGATSAVGAGQGYGAPPLPISGNQDYSSGNTQMWMDPSYNFAYQAESSARNENADASGIIKGQYSYTNNEGNQIQVRYVAGPEIGFQVENEEDLTAAVQKATLDGAAVAANNRYQQQLDASRDPYQGQPSSANSVVSSFGTAPFAKVPQQMYGPPSVDDSWALEAASRPMKDYSLSIPASDSYGQPISSPIEDAGGLASYASTDPSSMVMDASFQFQVTSDDSTFEEVSDTNGERTGSYSYISPEGKKIEVRYRAGTNGFEILNPGQVFPNVS